VATALAPALIICVYARAHVRRPAHLSFQET
jgi:hypothetical protein